MYELDRTTGTVNWRLGGKRSDFRLGRGARFCRQHDARWVSDDEMTIFDNRVGSPRDRGESRAIKLAVDERRKRVRLLRGYKHPGRLAAPNKGGARAQPNGNVLVAWGAVPVITEFTRRGRIVLNARFAGATDGSYRALRADWVGRPTTDPAVAAQRRGDRVAVWASWNGATEVARWEVLGGAGPDALAVVGGGARNGLRDGALGRRAARVRGGAGARRRRRRAGHVAGRPAVGGAAGWRRRRGCRPPAGYGGRGSGELRRRLRRATAGGAAGPANCGWVGSGDAAGAAGLERPRPVPLWISTTDPANRADDRAQITADSASKAALGASARAG